MTKEQVFNNMRNFYKDLLERIKKNEIFNKKLKKLGLS